MPDILSVALVAHVCKRGAFYCTVMGSGLRKVYISTEGKRSTVIEIKSIHRDILRYATPVYPEYANGWKC